MEPRLRPSLLIQLPTEIRLKIFEHALGGNTVHIEQLSRYTQTVLARRGIHLGNGLYNELCTANETEAAAYQHFMTAGNNEERRTPFYSPATGVDPGLDHHVEAWTTRHNGCAREPNPRRIRLELAGWLGRPKLTLELLRTCKQIYREARLIPYGKNAFAFGSASTFQVFSLSRHRDHLAAVDHLNLLVGIGTAPFSDARARDWVQALTWRGVSAGISPLRTLNISVECYNGTAPDLAAIAKPEFDHFFAELPSGPEQRWTSWMKELSVLCDPGGSQAGLTVTIADDPLSPWGPVGKALYCQDTMTTDDEWQRKRAKACLTVEEKRDYAIRIMALLGQSPQEWQRILEGPDALSKRVGLEAL